jgi:hypothetical protein
VLAVLRTRFCGRTALSSISLNAFVPSGSDLTLSDATFISGRGEIAVNATLPNGDTHAVLLMPVGKGVNPSATASLRNEPVPLMLK